MPDHIVYQNIQVDSWKEVPKIGAFQVQYSKGTKAWYLDGRLHRTNGPAFIWANGYKEYWQFGQRLTKEQGPNHLRYKKIVASCSDEVPPHGLFHVLGTDGAERWYCDKLLHRTNGPAIIYTDGYKGYYQSGILHRTNGPAIINPAGYKLYYQSGILHRTNGPAIINIDGTKKYYQNGERHRTNGPAIIRSDGAEEYWLHGVQLTKVQWEIQPIKDQII